MGVWNKSQLVALLMLGCAQEHTIAKEELAVQLVDIAARSECLEICDNDLTCGRIESNEYSQCATDCEADCQELEVAISMRIAAGNSTFGEGTAAKLIRGVHDCNLATGCAEELSPQCQSSYLADEAVKISQSVPLTLQVIAASTNCNNAIETDAVTCFTTITRLLDDASLSLSCERPDPTAELWTCHCSENGVESRVVTGPFSYKSYDFSDLCWTTAQIACFSANSTSC